MNIQKLIDQTREIYEDEEYSQRINESLDYLEVLVKKEEEKRTENSYSKRLDIKIVKAVKDDFSDNIGPSTTTTVFLSIDGNLFDLGRFYQGPYMSESADARLGKILKFEEICHRLFGSSNE